MESEIAILKDSRSTLESELIRQVDFSIEQLDAEMREASTATRDGIYRFAVAMRYKEEAGCDVRSDRPHWFYDLMHRIGHGLTLPSLFLMYPANASLVRVAMKLPITEQQKIVESNDLTLFLPPPSSDEDPAPALRKTITDSNKKEVMRERNTPSSRPAIRETVCRPEPMRVEEQVEGQSGEFDPKKYKLNGWGGKFVSYRTDGRGWINIPFDDIHELHAIVIGRLTRPKS